MSEEIVSSGAIQPLAIYNPTLSQILKKEGSRQLDYLRGHEAAPSRLMQIALYGSAGVWSVLHYELIRDFVSGIVDIETKVIYGVGLGVVLYAIWFLGSNKTVQRTIAWKADSFIRGIHRSLIARNPESNARFDMSRFQKKLAVAEQAKAGLYSAFQTADGNSTDARASASHAFTLAQGFKKEIDSRARGNAPNPRIQMNDRQLALQLDSAKADLRRSYSEFQEAAGEAQLLKAKADMIQEILDGGYINLKNMDQQLASEIRRRDMHQKTAAALEAARGVDDSPERDDFNTSMQMISQQADDYSGITQMLLDRLQPSIQSYRAEKAGGAIADDDFFAAVASDPTFGIKPETQQKLLNASSAPVIDEMEAFLGSTTPKAAPVPVVRATPRSAGTTSQPHTDGSVESYFGDK